MITFASFRALIAKLWSRWQPKTIARRRVAAGIAFLVGSLLVSMSIFATAPNAAPIVAREKAWPVSVVEITPAPTSPMFNAFGRVEATQVAAIQTELVAEIESVAVREGQWVQKGDVLIELDAAAFELAVREREAELARERAMLARIETERRLTGETTGHYRSVYELAQKKLERHQELMAKRMISQSLLDEVVQQASAAAIEYQNHRLTLADFPNRIAEQQARVAQAGSMLDRARLDLDHATLHAPFSGPVLRVTAAPGNHTLLGQTLAEVADADGLEVRAPLPDAYTTAVRKHLKAGTRIFARTTVDDVPLVLDLARLGGSVRDGHSGLDAFYRVSPAALPLGDARDTSPLSIGLVLNLTVNLPPEPEVVALPVQSLYENDRIYEVENERLKAITVERVGDHQTVEGEFRVLVRSPELKPGHRVITTQLPKAISGLKVAPVG
jgi:multidrug efflux pump subunit AcrA (membrane-fusion protein)